MEMRELLRRVGGGERCGEDRIGREHKRMEGKKPTELWSETEGKWRGNDEAEKRERSTKDKKEGSVT